MTPGKPINSITGITVQEVDGSPLGNCVTLVFPNGSVGIVDRVATITIASFNGVYSSLSGIPSTFAPSAHSTDLLTSGTLPVARGGTGLSALGTSLQVLRTNAGATALEYATITTASGDALVANPLSQFAATTSAQLAGVISDETGSGALVFATSPTLVTPNIGAATGTSLAVTGTISTTANGAASTPAATLVGTWFTGGTATTTKPQLLVEPTGTTSTAWSTSGTGIGVNAASGFTGNLIDAKVAGGSRFKVLASGSVAVGGLTGGSAGAAAQAVYWELDTAVGFYRGVLGLGVGGIGVIFTKPVQATGFVATGDITASGTVTIGGGTPIAKVQSATATLDFPSIASNDTHTLTMTVTGAVAGNSVFVGVPAALDANLVWCASVTASDTVTIRMHNASGASIDPASGTYRATVFQF
jgi:hypothetical protein